jgi:hypothetical protein
VNHFIRRRNLFFPQLHADIHSTPIVKLQASPRLREHFHQSTTLITTTSFRVLFFLTAFVKALIPAVPVKILICSGPVFLAWKSSDRCISTAEKSSGALYTWRKNEYSTSAG